jgi:hypothetical protein
MPSQESTRYFIVSGVSRIGVTMTTHELLAEGTAPIAAIHEHLKKSRATRGIRVREHHHATASEILRAERDGRLVRSKPELPLIIPKQLARAVYRHHGSQPTGEWRVQVNDRYVRQRFGENFEAARDFAVAINEGREETQFEEARACHQ